jgi:hypothetical protein
MARVSVPTRDYNTSSSGLSKTKPHKRSPLYKVNGARVRTRLPVFLDITNQIESIAIDSLMPKKQKRDSKIVVVENETSMSLSWSWSSFLSLIRLA